MTANNMTIWDEVSKTDPSHTKQFKRAGGFSGTAIKPIWTIKRLTEQFGPVGKGWGMGEPSFNVVPADGELMVYCTVTCWHTDPSHTFVGVGGDKVTAKRKDGGSFNDDEAFKKAFTDAVGNAFKFVGFGADVHMGQFEDSKYVQEMEAEFAPKIAMIEDGQRDELQAMIEGYGFNILKVCQHFKISSLKDIPANKFETVKTYLNNAYDKKKAQAA